MTNPAITKYTEAVALSLERWGLVCMELLVKTPRLSPEELKAEKEKAIANIRQDSYQLIQELCGEELDPQGSTGKWVNGWIDCRNEILERAKELLS